MENFKLPVFAKGDTVKVVQTGEVCTITGLLPVGTATGYALVSKKTGVGLGWFFEREIVKS
jgi:hypothetical protein